MVLRRSWRVPFTYLCVFVLLYVQQRFHVTNPTKVSRTSLLSGVHSSELNDFPTAFLPTCDRQNLQVPAASSNLTIVQSISQSYSNDTSTKLQIDAVKCYARRHGYDHFLHIVDTASPGLYCERHRPVLGYFGRTKKILFLSTDVIIEPVTAKLDAIFDTARYAAQFPLRENNEINTEAYFMDGRSAFAKCFLQTWISKGCDGGNVDQGSLNELFLELFRCIWIQYYRYVAIFRFTLFHHLSDIGRAPIALTRSLMDIHPIIGI